jgi:hypothetical protein
MNQSGRLGLGEWSYPRCHDANVGAVYCGACGISVFHLGGDLLEQSTDESYQLDMALAWLLGMRRLC